MSKYEDNNVITATRIFGGGEYPTMVATFIARKYRGHGDTWYCQVTAIIEGQADYFDEVQTAMPYATMEEMFDASISNWSNAA